MYRKYLQTFTDDLGGLCKIGEDKVLKERELSDQKMLALRLLLFANS